IEPVAGPGREPFSPPLRQPIQASIYGALERLATCNELHFQIPVKELRVRVVRRLSFEFLCEDLDEVETAWLKGLDELYVLLRHRLLREAGRFEGFGPHCEAFATHSLAVPHRPKMPDSVLYHCTAALWSKTR